jgi:hypothetical protein
MLDEVFQSFSYPPGPGRELLNLIIGQSGRATVRRLVDLSACAVDRCSVGLTPLLRSWLEASGDAFWHPAVSGIKAHLNNSNEDIPAKCLVELGFVAQLDGAAGLWSFQFQGPTTLRIDRWSLPEITSGVVEGNGARISLRMLSNNGCSQILILTRDVQTGMWRRSRSTSAICRLPTVEFTPYHRILLLPREMADMELLPQFPGAAFNGAADLGQFANCLKQSAALISANASEYLSWIGEVINVIAPVAVRGHLLGSSSSGKLSGVISISDNQHPLSVAEFLVHEASHQYFSVATSLGEVDTGSEGQLFYSRFARRYRPLERILAGFHALGNIALFYEKCLANGIPCEARLSYIATHMRELDETLHNASTLTSLGQALWLPLSQKTRHIDMKADETVSNAVLAEADRVMAELKQRSRCGVESDFDDGHA